MLPNPLLTTMLVLSIKSTEHNYVNSSEVPRTPSSLPIQTKRQVRLPKQSNVVNDHQNILYDLLKYKVY